MRIALAQVSYDEEPGRSRTEYIDAVAEDVARRLEGEGVDLIVLPELWSTGAFRPKRWGERAEPLDGPTVTALADVARACGAVVHTGAIIERAQDGTLHNTAVVLDADGGRLASYRKIHRFAAGGLEAELLSPGSEVCVVDLPLRDGSTLRAGLSTCYDLRFPELYRAQSADGAVALLVPASWPVARIDAWELLLRARAVENQCLVVGVNAVGRDGKTEMGGGSVVLDATGERLGGSATEAGICLVDVDPAQVATVRDGFPVLADRRLRVENEPGPPREP